VADDPCRLVRLVRQVKQFGGYITDRDSAVAAEEQDYDLYHRP
jgi:hypothetical protein